MTQKFQNKYRIASARLLNWDYGWNAADFVTICTQNRECSFGDIVHKMRLSVIGEMAKKYWLEIPQHFPFVHLGEFVVMPNHVHGIIVIDKLDKRGDGCDGVVGGVGFVETPNIAYLQQQQPQQSKNKLGPQSQNLASIISGFKIGVTKNAKIIEPNFAWQPRFHDHIIGSEK